MLIHRGSTAKGRGVTVTERVKPQRRGKRELKQKQREREREIKQLTDTGERNEGVKEKRASVLQLS